MGSRLRGKRVLVTGAARGIGLAIAEQLAGEGARLALLDRRTDAVVAVAARLGPSHVAYGVDLSDPVSTRRVAEGHRRQLPPRAQRWSAAVSDKLRKRQEFRD